MQRPDFRFPHRFWQRITLLPLLLLLMSCKPKTNLIIYCDPWQEAHISEQLEAFTSRQPDISPELKVLSSEMIAQHLKMGQPMDLFVSCGDFFDPAGPMGDFEIADRKRQEVILGDDVLVKVEPLDKENQDKLGSKDCTMLAASDRPLRIFTDQWIQRDDLPAPTCVVISNFASQTQEYLLNGWVADGYVFGNFAYSHPHKMKITDVGPTLPQIYRAVLPTDAPHPQQAESFLAFLQEQK